MTTRWSNEEECAILALARCILTEGEVLAQPHAKMLLNIMVRLSGAARAGSTPAHFSIDIGRGQMLVDEIDGIVAGFVMDNPTRQRLGAAIFNLRRVFNGELVQP